MNKNKPNTKKKDKRINKASDNLKKLIDINPNLNLLIEKFDLKPIKK